MQYLEEKKNNEKENSQGNFNATSHDHARMHGQLRVIKTKTQKRRR